MTVAKAEGGGSLLSDMVVSHEGESDSQYFNKQTPAFCARSTLSSQGKAKQTKVGKMTRTN